MSVLMLSDLPYPRWVMLLAGLFFMILAMSLYRMVRDPLRKVPGPFLARFTRFWEIQAVSKGHFEQVDMELHRRYGWCIIRSWCFISLTSSRKVPSYESLRTGTASRSPTP